MSDPYACASLHVEHVEKEYAVGAGTEVEVQDPEGQYEGADPEQELEADFTNSFSQQGKHRKHYPSVLHKSKFQSYLIYLCI